MAAGESAVTRIAVMTKCGFQSVDDESPFFDVDMTQLDGTITFRWRHRPACLFVLLVNVPGYAMARIDGWDPGDEDDGWVK